MLRLVSSPFRFPCSDMARAFRARYYGGAFLTLQRGIPWEDLS